MLSFLDSSYDPGRHMPSHEDRVSRVSIVVRGTIWESVGRSEEIGSATSVVVKPAGVAHETRFGPEGARVISIVTDEPGLFDRWRWIHRGPAIMAAARFIAAKANRRSAPGTELEEHAWRLLEALENHAARADSTRPPHWLRRIHELLHDDPERTDSVAALALQAGVHPVHLTRAFRRHYHASITGYRSQVRVRAAAHQLASSNDPMAAVAPSCGFSDQSHLCRVFKKSTGVTPGRFRAAARNL